jgi:hypothetical protein
MLNNIKDEISAYGSRELEVRKQWYSPAADAYDRVRPRYPETLIQRSLEQPRSVQIRPCWKSAADRGP